MQKACSSGKALLVLYKSVIYLCSWIRFAWMHSGTYYRVPDSAA